MYLDIVVIDYLHRDGLLQSFTIAPGVNFKRVVIDYLKNIDPAYSGGLDADLGAFRIYNMEDCVVHESKTRPRSIELHKNGTIRYSICHMGIPVGSAKEAHQGYYCLMLPQGYNIVELKILDPYDRSPPENRKQFRRDVVYDAKSNSCGVILELRSSRGSFSFDLAGTIQNVERISEEIQYNDAYTMKYWSNDALHVLQGLGATQGMQKKINLRAMLGAILRTDSDFDAFCLDHFPEVARRLTNGMDRVAKVNLLLQIENVDDIMNCLRKHYADALIRYKKLNN